MHQLLNQTTSYCTECRTTHSAQYVNETGEVWYTIDCPQHPRRTFISSDATVFDDIRRKAGFSGTAELPFTLHHRCLQFCLSHLFRAGRATWASASVDGRSAATIGAHPICRRATAYRSRMHELVEVVRLVIDSPHIHFLLMTNCSRIGQIESLTGDLSTGITGIAVADGQGDGLAAEVIEPAQTIQCLRQELGLQPFGYLGSNLDPADPRWISYMLAAVRGSEGRSAYHPLKPSWTERLAMHLIHLLRGRFEFHQRQSSLRLRVQLLLNALTGGNLSGNLRILCRSLRPGGRLWAKHLVILAPSGLSHDGRVVHCRDCPDATIHEGHLVPPCLSDRFTVNKRPLVQP